MAEGELLICHHHLAIRTWPLAHYEDRILARRRVVCQNSYSLKTLQALFDLAGPLAHYLGCMICIREGLWNYPSGHYEDHILRQQGGDWNSEFVKYLVYYRDGILTRRGVIGTYSYLILKMQQVLHDLVRPLGHYEDCILEQQRHHQNSGRYHFDREEDYQNLPLSLIEDSTCFGQDVVVHYTMELGQTEYSKPPQDISVTGCSLCALADIVNWPLEDHREVLATATPE
ncbi:hypothetical protein EDD85DRAFT_785307 [Armillaria nabsnona]|nr:hypothetical protein EDD85DRAFT_785307 [Armillaria nabsnona]